LTRVFDGPLGQFETALIVASFQRASDGDSPAETSAEAAKRFRTGGPTRKAVAPVCLDVLGRSQALTFSDVF
jgi:hypothetical protein